MICCWYEERRSEDEGVDIAFGREEKKRGKEGDGRRKDVELEVRNLRCLVSSPVFEPENDMCVQF